MGICNPSSAKSQPNRRGRRAGASRSRHGPRRPRRTPMPGEIGRREMKMRTKSWVFALAVGSVGAVTGSALAAGLTPVADANTKVVGLARPNVLSPELAEIVQAQGAVPLENGTATIPFYGYDGDGPMLPAPGDVQSEDHNVEATKTEPDKNTYLVLDHAAGADPDYDYGR